MIDLAVRAPVQSRLTQVAWLGGTYAASNVARVALGFLSSVVVARALGPDGFGRWALWTAWAALLTMLFDGGFGVLVTRDAAREPHRAGFLVGAAVAIRLLAFAPVAIGLYVAAPLPGGADSRTVLPLVGLLAAAGLAYGGFASGFKGWPEWVPAIVSIETAGAAVNCAGAVAVVWSGLGVPALLAVASGVQVIQIAAALTLWQRVVGLSALAVPRPGEAVILIKRAWPFALSGLIANGQARVGPVVLGAFSSTNELALFGVASRIAEGVKMLPQAALAGVLPVLSAEGAGGTDRGVRHAFHQKLRWFTWTAAAGLSLVAYPLIRLTFGARYSGAWTALVVLALGLLPTLPNSGRRVYLYAMGREADATWWSGVSLAIQAVAAVLLVPVWGAAGAGLALMLGEAIVAPALRRAGDR